MRSLLRWCTLALRSSVIHDLVDVDEYSEFVDNIVVLRPLTKTRNLDIEIVREEILRGFNASTQLGVLKALYYFYYLHRRGARPKELTVFINRLSIGVKSNVVRAKLSYLHRKGLILKRGNRYIPREDLDLDDLEKLVDLGRAKAGRLKWLTHSTRKYLVPRYAEDSTVLSEEYNIDKLRKHILRYIAEGKYRNALAYLLFYGGGLRPSDIVEEMGYKEGFYAIVYEAKVNRYRLVCEEYDTLWRELLKSEELRQWLLEMIKRHDEERFQRPWKQECRWRISENEWSIMASSIKKKEKRIARRVYLCHQIPNGQAYTLLVKNGKPLVIGVHSDPSNDGYYIRR